MRTALLWARLALDFVSNRSNSSASLPELKLCMVKILANASKSGILSNYVFRPSLAGGIRLKQVAGFV
jgi:hypothetical protein